MSILQRCSRNPRENWDQFRYLNKGQNYNERNLIGMYWDEIIGRLGAKVEYYTYNYSLTTHDFLYGEEPTADFSAPITTTMAIDIPSESVLLSKFGLETDADLVAYITVEEAARVFNGIEPKSGDVIRLVELGWDSSTEPDPNNSTTADSPSSIQQELCYFKNQDGTSAEIIYPPVNIENPGTEPRWIRCPQLFEITERIHQDINAGINALQGHYVWILKAKRFDYSYMPGISGECWMGDVGEETRTGIISGGLQPTSPEKEYDQNVDDHNKDYIWDYDDPNGIEDRNDNVYGEY